MALDIGIVYNELSRHGGAEIYLLECIRRWQNQADITLYVQNIDIRLLWEYGIARNRIKLELLPKHPLAESSLIHALLVSPRIWENTIDGHDVYLLGNAPAQYVRKKPAVHLIHEPPRLLYDQRPLQGPGGHSPPIHVYPNLEYFGGPGESVAAELDLIGAYDASSDLGRIVTTSRKTSEYIKLVYGRPADLVAYPGVYPAKPGTAEIIKRGVFAGSLWSHKNVDLLIEALSMVPEGELLIVGDGPERDKLMAMTERLGVVDRVRFSASVSSETLHDLFATSACGLYVPENEPFGMMPLDIAAVGRPSVVTNGGGYLEILDDSSCLAVEPKTGQIAEAMRKMFADPDYADAMGSRAYEKASTLNWDNTAGKILDLLREGARGAPLSLVSETAYGAHYYPWYRHGEKPRHWNENRKYSVVKSPPLAGEYDSVDIETIDRHIALARKAGLDHFIVNLHVQDKGIHEHDLAAVRNLFARCNDADFKLSIMLVIQSRNPGTTAATIRSVISEFTNQKAYQWISGSRPIWYFLTDGFMSFFYNHNEILSELNTGLCTIASGMTPFRKSLPRPLKQFFNGWSPYSPLQLCSPEDWQDAWIHSYNDFCAEGGHDSIRVFSVCPGYDDTGLKSSTRAEQTCRLISRDDGRVFTKMLDTALELDPVPDLVAVTSFNEFHESTNIEPCVVHGSLYIDISRSFRERLAIGKARRAGT